MAPSRFWDKELSTQHRHGQLLKFWPGRFPASHWPECMCCWISWCWKIKSSHRVRGWARHWAAVAFTLCYGLYVASATQTTALWRKQGQCQRTPCLRSVEKNEAFRFFLGKSPQLSSMDTPVTNQNLKIKSFQMVRNWGESGLPKSTHEDKSREDREHIE